MDDHLTRLFVERGRLQERIRTQRAEVIQIAHPLGVGLNKLSRVGNGLRRGYQWILAHPVLVTVAVVTVVVWRPRIVWRLATTGFTVWHHWKRIRKWLLPA